jgi:hypothetical protein
MASESEVEDEESSPVIEASSPTAADGGKMATAPLITTTTTTTGATTAASTATDGDKEGRVKYHFCVRDLNSENLVLGNSIYDSWIPLSEIVIRST